MIPLADDEMKAGRLKKVARDVIKKSPTENFSGSTRK
jgi:hypothetical protein